jgi:hypothetical protein
MRNCSEAEGLHRAFPELLACPYMQQRALQPLPLKPEFAWTIADLPYDAPK